MYGGYGGFAGFGEGYASSMDSNPYMPGTQINRFDTDLTRPGVQGYGSVNGMPHYSSAYDTNPYVSGTQMGGMGMGMGGMGMGGMGYRPFWFYWSILILEITFSLSFYFFLINTLNTFVFV